MNPSPKTVPTHSLALCALFAAMIAVGALIRIPIPLVPFTLQFLFTTLAGLLLGAKQGTVAVAIYIVIGLAGLPVFSQGGGLGYVLQPTFGYIIGFCLGTYVTGRMVEKAKVYSTKKLLAANFSGLIVVYTLGMVYYYLIAHFYLHAPVGVWALIFYCFILAVPGDIIICFVSASLAKRLIPIFKRKEQ